LALRTRRVRGESLRVPLEPDEVALEALLELIAAQPERPLVILTRRALLHPAQAHAVDALLAVAPEALLVAALEPFDVARFPQARNVACTYGDDEPSFEALADVLAGRAVARGRLPVTLALVSA
jgi:beta-N-acetylhexosaminidase